MSSKRVTVYEAARVLDLSVDAIRKRVQRGAIPYEKDAAGRVHILLDESETLQDKVQDTYGTSPGELVQELREQNAYLREIISTRDEEIRRRDHIIAAMANRIPELEPAPEQPPHSEPSQPAQEPPQEPPDNEPGAGPGAAPPSQSLTGRLRRWWRGG